MEGGRYTVVVADDEADQRERLSAALERTGRFTVVARAADGAEVVDLVREHRPDLTLVDLTLGTVDGLDVVPLIRAGAPECAVVVMAGVEDEVDRAGGAATSMRSLRLDERPGGFVDELLQVLASSPGVAAVSALTVHDGGGTAARTFVTDVLHDWGAGAAAATATLLACDAIGSASAGEVEITVRLLGERRVRVEVGTAEPTTEGLAEPRWRWLLEHYAQRWGTAVSRAGAVVWFELAAA